MALIQLKQRFVRPARPSLVRPNTSNPLSRRLTYLCVEPVAGKLINQVVSQRHPGTTIIAPRWPRRELLKITGEVERHGSYWSHLESRADGFESVSGDASMAQGSAVVHKFTLAVCIRKLVYVSQGSSINSIVQFRGGNRNTIGYSSTEHPFLLWQDTSSNNLSGVPSADGDEWHVWVARQGPDGKKFWANGVLELDEAPPGASSDSSGDKLAVGKQEESSNRDMTGDMMWIAAWADEVPDHLCKELSRPESGLIWSLFPGTARMVRGVAAAGGAISGSASITITPTGVLRGVGDLSGAVAATVTPTGTLKGTGDLSGAVAIAITSSGTLRGTGDLSGAITATFTSSGTLRGMGLLSGTVAIVVTPAGTLIGAGSLSGAVPFTLTPTGTLTGLGTLSGSIAITLTPSGTLIGLGGGVLSGSIALALTPTGTLKGLGGLSGATSITVTVSGTLKAPGDLAGTVSLTLTPTGTLRGGGTLAGQATITFTVTGSLIDAALGAISGTVVFTLIPTGTLEGRGAPLPVTVIAAPSTNPLLFTESIVDQQGRPTKYFLRQWLSQRGVNASTEATIDELNVLVIQVAAIRGINLLAGVGLDGGGDLSGPDRTFNLADTSVVPGDYTNTDLTVDQQGRIIAAANGSGGGGGGGPTVIGETTILQASAASEIIIDSGTPFSDFDEVYFLIDVFSDITDVELRAVFREAGADLGGSTYQNTGELNIVSSTVDKEFDDNATAYFKISRGLGSANWDIEGGEGYFGRILIGSQAAKVMYRHFGSYVGVFSGTRGVVTHGGGYFISGGSILEGIRIFSQPNTVDIYGTLKMIGTTYS